MSYKALATFQASAYAQNAATTSSAMDTTDQAPPPPAAANAIPADVVEKITAHSKDLSAGRRKRVKPDGLATVEEISAFSVKASHAGLHSASTPGITALDVHPANDSIFLTGGIDKSVVLFNSATETVTKTFKVYRTYILDAVRSYVILGPQQEDHVGHSAPDFGRRNQRIGRSHRARLVYHVR